MKIAIIKIALLMIAGVVGDKRLTIINEDILDFSINANSSEDLNIKMFYALLDKDMVSVRCDDNGTINFNEQILPLDIHKYYANKEEENYYSFPLPYL